MPYWILETLSTTPAFAWVYFGVGVPWALAVLPRRDWRSPFVVLAAAFALGPALLTVHMLALGVLGAQVDLPLLRIDLVLGGTVIMTILGLVLVFVRSRRPEASGGLDASPLRWDEKLLIGLMVGAHVLRWFVAAYWPFIAYDTLWVYGYQSRLYTLLGYIPNTIDYYPQFLQLQYVYGQLVYGGINDHAARAVVPFINLGATFAVYVLGTRLFTRRVGIYAAAIWTFYHHVAGWSRMGDLEIVTAFSFTLAACFFISAWRSVTREEQSRRLTLSDHEAVLSGIFLGIALWTKPTAGAFVWGVLLVFAVVVIVQIWRSRHLVMGELLPYLRIAVLTGIACAPLGGVWYLRNILLGHAAVRFPPGFWLDRAAQSGAEWGWLLLAFLVFTGYVLLSHRGKVAFLRVRAAAATSFPVRWRVIGLLAGSMLILLGLLPSILFPRRMHVLDWLLLAAGGAVVALTLYRAWQDIRNSESSGQIRRHASVLALVALLGLPYFVTWFFSYSYDPRLSFVIVPLMILPTALLASAWIGDLLASGRRLAANAVGILIVVLATPGFVIPLYDGATGWDGLWSGELPNDLEKQRSGNQALIRVVDGLQIYLDTHDEPLRVVAPGLQTLPFFFPLEDIRIDVVPWRLAELDGAVYFIDSVVELPERLAGRSVIDNQVLGALRREDIMRRAWWYDDGTFSYDVYELHLDTRFVDPQPNGRESREVIFGGFARYMGEDLGGLEFWQGRPLYATLYWEPITTIDKDYMMFVHLRDRAGNLIRGWDAPVAYNDSAVPPRYYSTLVWEPGEYIRDVRILRMGEEANEHLGVGYSLWVGFYDLSTGERVPVTVDGETAGDSWLIDDRISIIAPP